MSNPFLLMKVAKSILVKAELLSVTSRKDMPESFDSLLR